MDSAVLSTQSPHRIPSSVASRRSKSFPPLRGYDKPQVWDTNSFSTMASPTCPPMTPMSPTVMSPMSPPMSAKSFGTFIDSAPSTPAYSPRMGSGWGDSSTLMLLSPASTAPSSPPEPQWEMLTPAKKPKPYVAWRKSQPMHAIILEEAQKENIYPPGNDENVDPMADGKAAQAHSSPAAPLGRIATRMKSILRRKSAGDKNNGTENKIDKRRRKYQELDYMEDVHWSEM